MYSCLSSSAPVSRQLPICGAELIENIYQVTAVVLYGGKVVQIIMFREDTEQQLSRIGVRAPNRIGMNQRTVYNTRNKRTERSHQTYGNVYLS